MDLKTLTALTRLLAQRWVEQANAMVVLCLTAGLGVMAGLKEGWPAYALFATWCGVVALPVLVLLLKKASEKEE